MRFPMRVPSALPALRPRRDALLVAALLGLSLGACDDPDPAPPVRTLEGPADMTFACQGRMRVTEGQAPAADQPIVTTPMPLDACRGWHEVRVDVDEKDPKKSDDDVYTLAGLPPDGQGPMGLTDGEVLTEARRQELFDEWQAAIRLYGFVLQPSEGTVALVSQKLGATPTVSLVDGDSFAPGYNVLPVGTQPVGIATDPTGCHVMTANAGSCDLSLIEVASVLSGTEVPAVRSIPVINAAGDPLAARPRAIVAQPASTSLGFECPDSPDSLVYVAFPDCHAVAAIHAATGEIRAHIVFAEDGSAKVVNDGTLSCGVTTCGAPTTPPVVEIPDAGPPDVSDAAASDAAAPDAAAPDAGLAITAVDTRPRPVALHMASDGRRLYIGAENSPKIAIVDLGVDALPTTAQSVPLEGDVGVTALAATGPILMGGELGRANEGPFGEFRFIYAAATDNTVRVAEVGDVLRECDTQIDPRFLHDVRDGQELACLPMGDADPATPALPRRVGARSPGVHMPAGSRPLGIVFVQAPGIEELEDPKRPPISSIKLIGHFAYISLSTGNVVVVNVDDDNYGDVESTAVPVEVDLSLALPHQLRDTGLDRRNSLFCENADSGDGSEDDDPVYSPLVCDFDIAEDCSYPTGVLQGPPTMTAPSVTTLSAGYVAEAYLPALPAMRMLECVDEDGSTAVHELSQMVPDTLRDLVYPDLQSVRSETWNIVWEGLLSRQNAGALDPGVRLGYLEFDSGFSLHDGGAPFCEMGAEPGDLVTLRGCDPEIGDQHCQASETCAVLPDIDIQSQLGICLPAGSEDLVQQSCLPFFASRRRFLVEQTYPGRLVLAERKRVLRTTPAAGCSSDTQCAALYELEQDLALGAPLEAQSPQSTDRWACEPDPVPNPEIDPARNVCIMTCGSDLDCENGWQCSGDGYCVEAALPPAECVKTLQRYDVRAGNMFAVLGSATGFLHDRIVDPVTGQCVADPKANPLAQGRVPLVVPPCTGEGFLDVEPNPCATTVSHFEKEGDEAGVARQAPAIRFRNPAFVTHLVDPILDPVAQGITCTLDGAACPPMPAVPPGYAITFAIGSGFSPIVVAVPSMFDLKYPVRMVGDPLGSIWITDQGDVSAFVRGQVARFAPLTLQVTAIVQ
jgi:hypothetical protein